MLMRATVVGVALCLSALGLAASPNVDASIRKSTNIPAQELGSALRAFEKDRNLQVIFVSEDVRNVRTQGASGELTPIEALTQILTGTGLTYRYLDEKTVTIIPVASAPSTDASGAVPASPSAQPPPATEGSKVPSDRFRVAQVGQETSGETSSVEKKKEKPSEKKADELEEVVVTGTHIQGNTNPTAPIIVIDRADIERSGYTTIGDVMRSLPQNFSSVSPVVTGNFNAPNNGTPDAETSPDLRGIGPSSTLTLVNGQRIPYAFGSNSSGDISWIPLDMVDRVEIVTDGASAIYGSDAVAGVVNFILKKSFDGLQTAASYGTATDGGGGATQASVLAGTHWSSGNVLAAYQYSNQDPVEPYQRSFTSTAPSPNYLIPKDSFNTGYLSLRQEIDPNISAFIQASYSNKTNSTYSSLSIVPFGQLQDTSTTQYSVSGGVDFNMDKWTGSLNGAAANQRINTSVFGYSTSNPADLSLQSIFDFKGSVESIELNTSGPLFDLGAVPIQAAFGGGSRHETVFSDTNHAREVSYVFGEVQIPVIPHTERLWLRRLDLNVSGRCEHYSVFGSECVPKIGATYSPVAGLYVRSTWGRSYRAPPLFDLFGPDSVVLAPFTDPHSPSGSSIVALLSGANPALRPETAQSWTAGFDYSPPMAEGLKISATYFNIDYTSRIYELPGSLNPLLNPADAPFVQRNPTPAQVQALVNAYGIAGNQTGQPYDPTTVNAIFDDIILNVSEQFISGFDFLLDYKHPIAIGNVDVFANAAYLHYTEKLVPLAPADTLSGTVFNPPTFRGRGGVTWNYSFWSTSLIVNYTGRETNNLGTGLSHVGSWTTVDATVIYSPTLRGWLKDIRVSAAVQNLLDKNPPFFDSGPYVQGLNYDPYNATPLGRFVTFKVSKKW
jgi:outer membrane receptor protein involved in Fe transport